VEEEGTPTHSMANLSATLFDVFYFALLGKDYFARHNLNNVLHDKRNLHANVQHANMSTYGCFVQHTLK
jgi:hypothetical protein